MRTTRTVAAAFAGLALTLAACSAASPSPSGTDVTATLKEYKIELSANTAPAGKVTFNVTNAGTMIHEFVVLKTDVQAADLPIANDEVTEDDYTVVDEVEDVEAAKSGTLTVTLEAGHYVLICNIAGHVRQGMATDFTVS